MNCPKCGNTLREDMFCENCKEYLFNMDKPKKGDTAKSWLKVFGITLGCCAIFVCIIVGICKISEVNHYNNELNSRLEEIRQDIADKDYRAALGKLENYKSRYADDKKASSKIMKLSDDIESGLYESRDSEDLGISSCEIYLEYYAKGKYENEIKETLSELWEKQAIQNISDAKHSIQKNDVLNADYLLEAVVDNSYVSENTKKQANELLKSISSKVTTAKGKKAILGTWRKDTGVTYTFEEDCHMSVSMSSNYDSSAGTALDGREVKSLLSEIEDFSRIVRGGTWEYIGTQKLDSETFYVYSLFYYSSQYTCFIPINDTWKMGINLSSGIGDMSILTK